MTDTDTVSAARIVFDVTNVPLQRPLVVDMFVLNPIAGVNVSPKRWKRLDVQSRITATGTFALLPAASWDQPDDAFWHPARRLELLLSFANRCHVRLIRPTLEVQRAGQWIQYEQYASPFTEGRARAKPWYGDHDELAGFLQRNFAKFNETDFGADTGLQLALEFYEQALSEAVLEMRYLKTWIALEILYGHAQDDHIISDKRFKKLKKRLQKSLTAAVEAGELQEAERSVIVEKLLELNRLAAKRQVVAFCNRVFSEYPDQRVSEAEIQRLITIRNAITQRGLMNPATDEDYMPTLGEECGRLKALLERIILVLLQERPHLMEISWRDYRFGR